ncbi:hypothetical protein Lser_V15G02376 [Lactuca serriola]
MRGFEFFNLVSSYTFDSLSLIHLKATRRIKFQGKVVKPVISISDEQQTNTNGEKTEVSKILAGDVSITTIFNQDTEEAFKKTVGVDRLIDMLKDATYQELQKLKDYEELDSSVMSIVDRVVHKTNEKNRVSS